MRYSVRSYTLQIVITLGVSEKDAEDFDYLDETSVTHDGRLSNRQIVLLSQCILPERKSLREEYKGDVMGFRRAALILWRNNNDGPSQIQVCCI